MTCIKFTVIAFPAYSFLKIHSYISKLVAENVMYSGPWQSKVVKLVSISISIINYE